MENTSAVAAKLMRSANGIEMMSGTSGFVFAAVAMAIL